MATEKTGCGQLWSWYPLVAVGGWVGYMAGDAIGKGSVIGRIIGTLAGAVVFGIIGADDSCYDKFGNVILEEK